MSIIKFMDVLVSKGFPQDISRKIIHIAAGSWVIFWPLYYAAHISYVLNIAIALLWTVLFVTKGLTATPDDPAVKTMTRTGDPKELLRGPLFFTITMEILGIFFFMKFSAVAAMAVLGWGDGLAPLFGKYYGKHKYKLIGREKTIEGSIGMFLFGYIGLLVLSLIVWPSGMPLNITQLLISGLIISLIATIVEALSPADVDNFIIPFVVVLILEFFPFLVLL